MCENFNRLQVSIAFGRRVSKKKKNERNNNILPSILRVRHVEKYERV